MTYTEHLTFAAQVLPGDRIATGEVVTLTWTPAPGHRSIRLINANGRQSTITLDADAPASVYRDER